MVTGVVCGFQSASESVKVLVTQMDPTPCNLMDYIAHWSPLSMGFSRQEYWSG